MAELEDLCREGGRGRDDGRYGEKEMEENGSSTQEEAAMFSFYATRLRKSVRGARRNRREERKA